MSTDTATGLVVLTGLILLAKFAMPDVPSKKEVSSKTEASYVDTDQLSVVRESAYTVRNRAYSVSEISQSFTANYNLKNEE